LDFNPNAFRTTARTARKALGDRPRAAKEGLAFAASTL
jgi:hypothetical protein